MRNIRPIQREVQVETKPAHERWALLGQGATLRKRVFCCSAASLREARCSDRGQLTVALTFEPCPPHRLKLQMSKSFNCVIKCACSLRVFLMFLPWQPVLEQCFLRVAANCPMNLRSDPVFVGRVVRPELEAPDFRCKPALTSNNTV
jgi:hypothetical protein